MTDDISPGIRRLWAPPAPAARRGLSVDRIVEAAIALADEGGLEAVSMARVADRLGFTTMSLYRHVAGKDELLVLMADAVVGAPPAVDPGAGWRSALRRWGTELLALLVRHPWYVQLPITGPPVTPNLLRWLDSGLRALAGTPLSEPEKAAAILSVNGQVFWEARLVADMAIAPERTAASAALLREVVDAERFPALRQAIDAGIFEDDSSADDAAFGLERVLDGIAALVERR
jgi:AcrR family transcriptional regulator